MLSIKMNYFKFSTSIVLKKYVFFVHVQNFYILNSYYYT